MTRHRPYRGAAFIPERLSKALDRMVGDLRSYAASGNAKPEWIMQRQQQLDDVIDGVNAMESEHVSMVQALKNDLRHRDQVTAARLEPRTIDMEWSLLEGRAQMVITGIEDRAIAEENRSLTPAQVERVKEDVAELRGEFDSLYDQLVDLMMECGRMNTLVDMLGDWCYLNGIDPDIVTCTGGGGNSPNVFRKARIQLMRSLLDQEATNELFRPSPERTSLARYLILSNSVLPEVASKYNKQLTNIAEAHEHHAAEEA